MTEETMSVVTTINAPAQTVFDVLADPSTHEAIDGTGWVRQPLDDKHLTETGQVFRMAMYHENHPDKDYEMANRVEVFDPPQEVVAPQRELVEPRGIVYEDLERATAHRRRSRSTRHVGADDLAPEAWDCRTRR